MKQQIFIASVYSPVEYDEQQEFNKFLHDVYTDIPKNALALFGQDMNVLLGTHQVGDGYDSVLGIFGIAKRNAKGQEMLDLLCTHKLTATTTLFQHNAYSTWINFAGPDQLYQIDHWVTNRPHAIKNAYVSEIGLDSDHSALILEAYVKAPKQPQKLIRDHILYELLHDAGTRQAYNNVVAQELEKDPSPLSWTSLANAISTATKSTLSVARSTLTGWYDFSKTQLAPLFAERSNVLNSIRQDKTLSPSIAKNMYRTARKNLADAVTDAKARRANHLASKIHGVNRNPKQAWKAV